MPKRRRAARSRTSSGAFRTSRNSAVLGIDLGATKVATALVNADGRLATPADRRLHANDGPEGVIATVVAAARACLATARAGRVRIGVSVAAQVDPETGEVVYAPNLRWRNVALGSRLAQELQGTVTLINDARAATLAEWQLGAGIGASDLFCVSLGTGVGGSAVVGGRLLDGGGHAAGEIGHLTIVSGGRRCHCPNTGCLEAYVGGWAIADRAQQAVREDPASGAPMLDRAGRVEAISAETVFVAYRGGDPLATRLVRETERYLGDGAVSIANAFNPSRIVLVGGLTVGLPGLDAVARGAIRARCQPPAAGAEVVLGRLGEFAALVGAATAARSSPER
jgi:glucokinase